MRHAVESGSAGTATTRSSYKLRIIVTNLGHAIAKHARVVVSFENIDIVKIIDGPNHRIDNLRNGLPTLQWDNPSGVIYANAPGGDVIWDMHIRLQKNKWGTITWEAQAEDMDYIKDTYVLLGVEHARPNAEIEPYWLPRYEDFFSHKPNNSVIDNDKT